MMTPRWSRAGYLYIWVCLTTEFWHIRLLGGVIRPYHVATVLLLLFLMREVDRAFATAPLRNISVYLIINLITSLAVASWKSALLSYALYLLNALIAVVVSGVMLRYFDRDRIASVVLAIGVATVAFSLVQFIGTRLGVDTSIAATQRPFVVTGEVSSFWTEPDQLGKFLSMPFLLALVYSLHGRRHGWGALAFLGLGIMLNFVRAPLYGLVVAVAVLGMVVRRDPVVRRRLAGAAVGILLTAAVFSLLASTGVIPLGSYPLHRLSRIADVRYASFAEDGSGGYRIESARQLVDRVLETPGAVVTGLGLNQASGTIGGVTQQLGGGDIVNLFGGSGIPGVVSYVLLVAPLVYVPMRRLRRDPQDWFAQWLLATAVAFIVTGQMSGMLLAPEFYVLVAATAFMEYSTRDNPILEPAEHQSARSKHRLTWQEARRVR